MNSSSTVVTGSNESRFLASSAARSTRALEAGDLPQVDPVLLGERVADEVEQQLVEVVAAELGVAVAGVDLDDAVLDLRQRDVERAAAQVVDQQPLHLGRVRVVGQHGGGRLVDDPDDLQAGQLARLAGRLPLAVVEERRDRDHRLRDRMPQRLLGAVLERPQDDGRDLLRRVLLVAEGDGHLLAHLPLDRPDGPLRRQDVLVARGLADQQVALRVQADDRRQDRVAVLARRTTGRPSRMTATSLLVVPRSMPMIVSWSMVSNPPIGPDQFERGRPAPGPPDSMSRSTPSSSSSSW